MSSTPRIRGGIGADGLYWAALEAGEFRLPKCASCERWQWPALHRCPHCGGWELEWVRLEPVGRVYTWTRAHQAPPLVRERAEDAPYVAILAEIPAADGARVVGAWTGSDDGLAIGAQVRGVFLPPSPRSKGYASLAWELAPESRR